jgi:hypothetical protein
MRILPNWKQVLRRAWSVRFLIAACVFSAGEVILPFFVHDMPRGWAVALSALCCIGGLVSRFVAQPEVNK